MDFGKTRAVVILADGFQELEFWYPVLRLREAGATVVVAGAGKGGDDTYTSRLGYPVIPDVACDAAGDDATLVVVPGADAAALAKAARWIEARYKAGATVVAIGSAAAALKAVQPGFANTSLPAGDRTAVARAADRAYVAASADAMPALFRALAS